ncbi:hypothetical protein Emed_005497 [Eimeria media]
MADACKGSRLGLNACGWEGVLHQQLQQQQQQQQLQQLQEQTHQQAEALKKQLAEVRPCVPTSSSSSSGVIWTIRKCGSSNNKSSSNSSSNSNSSDSNSSNSNSSNSISGGLAGVEASLESSEKQQRRYVALINDLRDRLQLVEAETTTLRTERTDLTQKVHDQQRKLEALKRLSLSAQSGGTPSAETDALRAIVWKQQLELQQLQLRNTAADPAADGFYRKLQQQQQIRQQQQQRQQQPQQQQQQQAVQPSGHTAAEGGVEGALKLIEEFKAFEAASLRHSFSVPLWDPAAPPGENRKRLQKHKAEHDALCMQANALGKKLEKRFSGLVAEAHHPGFGEHASVGTSHFLRRFADLKDLAFSTLQPQQQQQEQQQQLQQQPQPAMRIHLQGLPPWLSSSAFAAPDASLDAAAAAAGAQPAAAPGSKQLGAATPAAFCSAAATAAQNMSMKLVVTEDQLAQLYRRIAGI